MGAAIRLVAGVICATAAESSKLQQYLSHPFVFLVFNANTALISSRRCHCALSLGACLGSFFRLVFCWKLLDGVQRKVVHVHKKTHRNPYD